MDFQLANGKLLHINGSRFTVDVSDNKIEITIMGKYEIPPRSSFDDQIKYILNDTDTPSYIHNDDEDNAEVIKLSELEKSTEDHDEIAHIGKVMFQSFIETWSQGFGDEEAEQPDRVALLNSTMSDYSLHIIRYVRSVGGLTSASMRAFPTNDYTETSYRERVRLLAENIAQVSSILCPPLGELLEYPFLINLKQFQGE